MTSRVAIFTLVATMVASTAACAEELKNDKDKLSYALGAQIGGDLKRNQIEVDVDTFVRALRDAVAGNKLSMSEEEMRTTMQNFQTTMRQKQTAMMQEMAEKNKKASDAFLAENKKKEGVVTRPSGIQYKVITQGKGKKPGPKDTVVAHYTGTLIDGTKFDSSQDRGQPATFPLDGVIKGWQEVMPLMPTGSKWQVVIPPELAYGPRGAGPQIGPNQALIFDIELLEVQPATTAPGGKGKPKADAKSGAKSGTKKPAEKPAAPKPDAGGSAAPAATETKPAN